MQKMVAPLNHFWFDAYQLKKQAVQIHKSYGCCTYTTTEALYIGKTAYRQIQIQIHMSVQL